MDLKPEVWSIFLVQKRELLFVAAKDIARTRCKALVFFQHTLAAIPSTNRSAFDNTVGMNEWITDSEAARVLAGRLRNDRA